MKVQNSNTAGIAGLRNTEPASSGAANVRAPKNNSGGNDQVHLSSLSSHLGVSVASSAERSSKVAELSSAVSSGRYNVEAQAVSSSMIHEHMRVAA